MKKKNNEKTIIIILSILVAFLLLICLYLVFTKEDKCKESVDCSKQENQINDNNQEENPKKDNSDDTKKPGVILGISGTYTDKKTNKQIKIEETEEKILVYENDKVLLDEKKYDEENELIDICEIVDDYVVIYGGQPGQFFEYAVIVNKNTKEIVRNLTKIDNRGAYEIAKVNGGYFFVLMGAVNNEATYFYEAFSNKNNIVSLSPNEYNHYVYGVSNNYLYFAKEKGKRDNKKNVRISRVSVDGKYEYSVYYEAILTIENDYALAIKDNVMYLIDVNNNFKEYKICDYKEQEIWAWHIKKENNRLYINNWGEELTEYLFDINNKKVSIYNGD